MLFLNEAAALTAVQDLLSATQSARLAVAFWGIGAIQKLGLDRRGLELQIVCNLDSGACNPHEIRKLLALVGEGKLLSDPRLHGKVYWTPSGAVVGSSNASANGLAVEGDALTGWAEANILTTDSTMLAHLSEWIDDRAAPSNAYAVTEEVISVAEALWKRRRQSAAPGVSLKRDMLAAYRSAPSHPVWKRVRVFVWTKDVNAEGKREAKAMASVDGKLSGLDYYQYCQEELRAGDFVLEINASKTVAKYESIYAVLSPKAEGKTLTFVKRIGDEVTLSAFGKVELLSEGQVALATVANRLLDRYGTADDRYCVIDLADAIAEMDLSAAGPQTAGADPRAFEAELLRQVSEAQKLGYHPTGFLDLVKKHGGVGAAKKLLQPGKPAEGFIKLVMKGRTDLSVEHLSLEAPWSTLFDETELREARKRLGRPL